MPPNPLLNQPLCTESGDQRGESSGESERLVHRLRQRDAAAFDRMVELEGPAIQRLVSRLLGWRSESDDVVQEVFISAWESIHRFRGEASISSWLYSIALNQCRKHHRRRTRWREAFQRLCERNRSRLEENDPTTTRSELNNLFRAIEQLPHRDRELIVLSGLEEKSVTEIAELTGLRKNTLEVRLHRARKRLKELLRQAHEEND